jgi:hypothetical protein
MSGMRLTSGKLTPIKMTEKRAAQICKGLGIEREYGEEAMQSLSDETDDYAIIDGLGFCTVTEFVDESEPTDWCTVTKNPHDESWSFQAYYYDGGVNWPEFVESTLKNSE